MPLKILLCHHLISTNSQDKYTANFEYLKSFITQLFPEPHYEVNTLFVNQNDVNSIVQQQISDAPIVIFYEDNNRRYARVDDLYNYEPLIKKSKYVVVAHVFDPLSDTNTFDRLNKFYNQSWIAAYSGDPDYAFRDKSHRPPRTYLRNKFKDVLIINKNIPIANFNLLLSQTEFANFSQTAALTDDQAKIMLQSLQKLLLRGPLNNLKTPYDVLVGGIKDELTQVTFPTHIQTLLNKINTSLSPNNAETKTHLAELISDIKELALNPSNPITRSVSTHQFYTHTLPLFIAHSMTSENICAKENISRLTEEDAQEILNNFAQFLIKDSYGATRTYYVGFFGGKKHQLQQADGTIITMKIPSHIFQLLNLLNNTNWASNKEKLLHIFDETILAGDSLCSSRTVSTRGFYAWLPSKLAELIKDIATKPPQNISPLQF